MRVTIDPLTGMPIFVEEERIVSRGGGISGGGAIPEIPYGTSVPSDDNATHTFWNTATETYYIYSNGAWHAITGGTPPVTLDVGANAALSLLGP